MARILMPEREKVEPNQIVRPSSSPERRDFRCGFVRAGSALLPETDDGLTLEKIGVKHEGSTTKVIETRGNHRIVNSGEQFWVETLTGQVVAGPWRAAFIAYGWLKQLEQGAHGDAPQVSTTSPFKHGCGNLPPLDPEHKSDSEKEDEAEESLDAKVDGKRK